MDKMKFLIFVLLFSLALMLLNFAHTDKVLAQPVPDYTVSSTITLVNRVSNTTACSTTVNHLNNGNYTFQFNCTGAECVEDPTECGIEYSTTENPLWSNSYSMFAQSRATARDVMEAIYITDCNGTNCRDLQIDYTFFCAVEGIVDLVLVANPEEEPGNYTAITKDCRPSTKCYDETLNENISGPLDARSSVVMVQTDINVVWDDAVDSKYCDCYLGADSCAGQSCWNISIPFEAGTVPPCCGDDILGGGDHEQFNWLRCGDVWDPGMTDNSMCDDDISDVYCCDNSDDCVYSSACYTDDSDPYSAELFANMTCSHGVWCPLGYVWDEASSMCEYGGLAACYSNDPTLPYTTTCNSSFTDQLGFFDDLWQPPAQDCYNGSASPDTACCPSLEYASAEYYQYADVVVY